MREFCIVTDSDSEIPYQFAEENDIPVFLMPYTLDGEEKLFDLGKNTDYAAFYKRLREGAEATTSTRSPLEIQEFFEEIIKNHKDILYICFSSALSAHYTLSLQAREEALKNYPDASITIIDSLSIAMGAGLLVYHAVKQKKEGKSLEEIADWLENNKKHVQHFFTVDSLAYLKRTGRLSAITATIGTMLDLKPVLTLTNEGKIVAYEKLKGKKKVIKYLVDKIGEHYLDTEESREIMVICHGDNLEQAEAIKSLVEQRYAYKNIWLMDVGPVIGCHAGPGVLAVLVLGGDRPL